MSRPDITEEEAGWMVSARSFAFDRNLHAAFLAAADDIAAGRKPEPYRPHAPAPRPWD